MKNKTNKKTISLVLVLMSIILIFFVVNKSFDKNENISQTVKDSEENQEITKLFEGSLYYLKHHDNANYIYKMTGDLEEDLIFTDEVENEKIKYVAGITNDGKIYLYMSSLDNIYGGSLYNIENNELNHIDTNFSTSQAPLISPNGKNIVYISFSNAQFEYGFSIYCMSTDGNNKLKIDTSDKQIPSLSFNTDGGKLAYILENKLFIYDFAKSEADKIADFIDIQPIVDIYWHTSDKILVHAKDTENENSIIYEVSINNKKKTLIYTHENLLSSKAVWSEKNYESFFLTDEENTYIIKNKTPQLLDKHMDLIISWIP